MVSLSMTKTLAHVSELPPRLRDGREDGFVTIEDAPEPSDEQKLATMRAMIAEGDADIAKGEVFPAEEVFEELEAELRKRHSL
jgi:predicted transcriptional regulator